MLIREATITDILEMQRIRSAVKENVLTNPDLVKHEDYVTYITDKGKGWVCEINAGIAGFAIVDVKEHNIWALFVDPDYERQGIGRSLHDAMMDWYFSQTDHTVWLSTAPQSRAASFYRSAGWQETGFYGKGEIKFEMATTDWQKT
jgi:GNAT superfamily N-acetyltransferase